MIKTNSSPPSGVTIRVRLSYSIDEPQRAPVSGSEWPENKPILPAPIPHQDYFDDEVKSQWFESYSNLAHAKKLLWAYMDSKGDSLEASRVSAADQPPTVIPRRNTKLVDSGRRIIDAEIKSRWLASYSNTAVLLKRLWKFIDS